MPIIVNADDLGYSETRDAGIFEAFANGAVSAASLLVNGPTAATAANKAIEVGLYLGLHLNLSEGESLSGPSSITNPENVMYYKHEFWELVVGNIDTVSNDIRKETVAQIERFKELTGAYPTHVDGHQHVHVYPHMPDILAPIFHAYGVLSVRIPDEDVSSYDWLSRARKDRYDMRFPWSLRARLVYRKHGIRAPDCFVGLGLAGHDMDMDCLLTTMAGTFGTVEWMVHPGHSDTSIVRDIFDDLFHRESARVYELEQLKKICHHLELSDWSCYDIFRE